jgi:hypothetical protein
LPMPWNTPPSLICCITAMTTCPNILVWCQRP